MRRSARVAAIAAFGFGYIAFLYLTLPDVRELRTGNPQSTAFMDLRAREARPKGATPRRVHQWVPYSRISPHLKRAVLVAEDAGFWGHEGIDLAEIRKSLEADWERGSLTRGASTITQQLAKNLYLSPTRNPLRKLTELFITRRLEHELSKTRIFELYLNNIEWGDGIWGAEAAAQRLFRHPGVRDRARSGRADGGRDHQSARARTSRGPNARLRGRQRIIRARMGKITPPPVFATGRRRQKRRRAPSRPTANPKTNRRPNQTTRSVTRIGTEPEPSPDAGIGTRNPEPEAPGTAPEPEPGTRNPKRG